MTRSLIHALREPSQRIDQLRESLLQIAESSLLTCKQHYRELTIKHDNLDPRKILERRYENRRAPASPYPVDPKTDVRPISEIRKFTKFN